MIEFYTVAVVALLAAISPGPDFVVVAKHAFCRSRQAALACAAGVSTAILVHTAYCVLGLALIISQSIVLFNMVKYCGAAYLIYIGIKSLTSSVTPLPLDAKSQALRPASCARAYREGFLTNLLNPKCTLFMLSVFTMVISPETSQWIQLSYGVEIALIAMLWFSVLAFGITATSVSARLNHLQSKIMKLTGAVLIALGVCIAFEKN